MLGGRSSSRSTGSWSSREQKINIKLEFFAKLDVVATDNELVSFSYCMAMPGFSEGPEGGLVR